MKRIITCAFASTIAGMVVMSVAAATQARAQAPRATTPASDVDRLTTCVMRKFGPEGDLMAFQRSGGKLTDEMKQAIADQGDPKDCIGSLQKACEEAGGKEGACLARETKAWYAAIAAERRAAMKALAPTKAAALARNARSFADALCRTTDRGLQAECVLRHLGQTYITISQSNRL